MTAEAPPPSHSSRVAIVGCGYVGSGVGAALAERGHSVIGTTTTPARCQELRRKGIAPVVLELKEVSLLHEVLFDRQTVLLTVAPGRSRRAYGEVYLEGVQNLLAAMAGTSVQRIIYTSSTSVYGQSDGSWVDEGSATEPRTESGRILLAAEQALIRGARSLDVTPTVLRLAGIVGPGRGPANVIPRYAGQIRHDGAGFINLIHRDDIVRVCVKLLDVPYAGTLNLSGDEPIRRRDYYDRVLARAGLPPIRWVPGEPPTDYGKRVSNRRIKQLLHLERLASGV